MSNLKSIVHTFLSNEAVNPKDFFYQFTINVKPISKLFDLTFECVADYGGEGMGDNYYSVYSFTKDNETVYVKFQGWYESYVGAGFSEWFFVEPKEKTITVYEQGN
jgi:hypothetical protein